MKKRLFIAFVFAAMFLVSLSAQSDSNQAGDLYFSASYSKGFIPGDPLHVVPEIHIFDLNFIRLGIHYELPLGPGHFAFGLEAAFCSGSRFGGKGSVDFYPFNVTTSYTFPLARIFSVGPSLKLGGFSMVSPDWSRLELMAGARLEAELKPLNFPVSMFVSGGADVFPNAYGNGLLPIFEVGARFPRGELMLREKSRSEDTGVGVIEDKDEKVETSTNLELQLSSKIEAKLSLRQSFIFPFLRGTGPLTQGNNIAAVLGAELTPVSMSGIAEINLTPAAFFVLSGGGQAGSGWNIPIANGIGLNKPENESASRPRRATIDGSAFDGLVWSTWGAGTLQFDLGAVLPGDWNHVLFQTRQEFRYSAYTRAGSLDSWVFEGDSGENKNGWVYNSSYVVGYHMPKSPVLDTIALMAELAKPLYNTPGGDFWGENLGTWTFSSLFNFSITPRFNTTLGLQMSTYRNNGTSKFRDDTYFYEDLELKSEGGQRRVLFYRAALVFNFKIR